MRDKSRSTEEAAEANEEPIIHLTKVVTHSSNLETHWILRLVSGIRR